MQPAHSLNYHARQKWSSQIVDLQLRQATPSSNPQEKERKLNSLTHNKIPMLEVHKSHQFARFQEHPLIKRVCQSSLKWAKRCIILQQKEKYRGKNCRWWCSSVELIAIFRVCWREQTSIAKFLWKMEDNSVKSQSQQTRLVLCGRQCQEKSYHWIKIK